MRSKTEIIKGAVLGHAVGDALGMPWETAARGTLSLHRELTCASGVLPMIGHARGMPAHWYREGNPAGTWTDDTSTVLAEMESVVRLGRVDPDDIMNNLCRWYFDAEFTPFGETLGEGRRTVAALSRFRAGVPAASCGGTDISDNGNGSLMRMLPFVFLSPMLERDGVTIRELSSLTHGHDISVMACEIFVDFARLIAEGEKTRSALASLSGLPAPFDRLAVIDRLPREEIKSTGFVVDTLEAALFCFAVTDTFEDCVLTAVDLCGDTDTVAAISGGLAGMHREVPGVWRGQLAREEYISSLSEQFASLAN